MKYLKLVGGVICIILGLISFGGLFYGRPIIEAIIGVSFWGTITYFLLRKNPKNKENRKPIKPITQNDDSSGKLQTLKELHEQEILTDTEYQNKVETLKKEKAELEEKRLLDELKKQDSYKKLKSLFDSGVLTKEEFDLKVKTLLNTFKDTYENKIRLVGRWYNDEKVLVFSSSYKFRYYADSSDLEKYLGGKWDVLDKNTIQLYYGNKNHNLKLIKLTGNFLNYEQNGKEFKFQKNTRL